MASSTDDEMGVLKEVSFDNIEMEPSESLLAAQAADAPIDAVSDPVSESVKIASAGENSELGQEDNAALYIQLGDDVVIESKTYGRTIGTVYFRSEEMIHIKPDGVSNDVHRFAVSQIEDEEGQVEEEFNEDDGVSAIYIIKKRELESFVEQQDFRVKQVIDTFDQDRKPYKTYTVLEVDKDNDKIVIQDPEEEHSEELNFNFIGIPSEKHGEFMIIRIRPIVYSEEHVDDEEEVEEQEEEEPEVIDDIGFDFEDVGEIEVVKSEVYKEAASYKQRIPDNIQRIDALNDFLSSLDPSLQNDKYALRSIRTLVETLFYLKQSTISYQKSGEIDGAKELSASTLVELIQRAHIPLGRPVLSISKKEYGVNGIDILEERKEVENIKFVDFKWELKQMNEKISTLVSSKVKGHDKIVTEWQDQRTILDTYYSPWKNNGREEPLWKALADSDFFRMNPPESSDSLPTLPGYTPSHDEKSPPSFYKIPFGMERALSATFRKGGKIEPRKVALLEEEKATMNSYLLFPIQAANYLGKTRSTHLAIDSGRSQLPPKTMKMLLRELGNPTELGATSNNIVLLDAVGSALGNIPLVDYIRGMTVPSLGLGDTFHVLEQYGMDYMELNSDLVEMLLEKVKAYQSQLLSSLAELREKIAATPAKEGEPNPFLESPAFLEEIQRQPILARILQDYEDKNPSLAASDLGKVIHLMKTYPSYFQIAAGKNSIQMGKAFIDANRTIYHNQLLIDQQMNYIEKHTGERPRKNPCNHVSDLVSVRRLHDDSERFYELTKVFRMYQGARNQNWIDCNRCKEHLLCCHERLQLQAYLNPKEKDTLEKEIVLMFAGGQFQGKYICRNCGQTIRDLDFDNNMEFDDNGKPKSGRAVLIDQDMIEDELLDTAASAPIETSPKEQMNLSDDQSAVYDIVRELSERIGIQLDTVGYRNVIRGAQSRIDIFPSRESYAADQKKSKGRMPDYEIALARDMINSTAVYLLLEIQTKIPAYVVRYALKGCKSPGFEGYPLETDETSQQGIQYVACAISSIRKKELPWSIAYQTIADDIQRQTGIAISMQKIIKRIVSQDIIQAQLEEKRRYLLHVFGKSVSEDGSRTRDAIPATFLPEQMIISPEDAAKQVISQEVVEALGNERARAALVTLWIRHAHAIAQRTAMLIRGSTFSETTCCMNKVSEPGSYWKSLGELPDIRHRTLVPHSQGQSLLTVFVPRSAEAGVTEPNKDLYYRLFLKCCFTGPRVGYSHQPGVTNQCLWCGFQFPTHPSIMDSDKEGKAALDGVETNTVQFTELLDNIHKVNRVEPVKVREITTVQKCMEELVRLEPAPVENWKTIMGKTAEQFMKLNHPDAVADDFTIAASELIHVSSSCKELIRARLTVVKYQTYLERISQLTWVDFFRVLQAYFITPLQRIASNFSSESFKIPIEMSNALSQTHVDEDLKPLIDAELLFLTSNRGLIGGGKIRFALQKIEYCLAQYSALLPFMERIRPSVIPGRDRALFYIQEVFLYGPLSTLLDASHIPGAEIDFGAWQASSNNKVRGSQMSSQMIGEDIRQQGAMETVQDVSIKFLLRMVASSLKKYNDEFLAYDQEKLKSLIADREEKERVNVVREFNKKSDEERQVELINKRLGIGKWAVGGTKLIYEYNKDYYDLERQKRIDAGMIDFPGHGERQNQNMDEFGDQYDNEEYDAENGYDHNEQNDDGE